MCHWKRNFLKNPKSGRESKKSLAVNRALICWQLLWMTSVEPGLCPGPGQAGRSFPAWASFLAAENLLH